MYRDCMTDVIIQHLVTEQVAASLLLLMNEGVLTFARPRSVEGLPSVYSAYVSAHRLPLASRPLAGCCAVSRDRLWPGRLQQHAASCENSDSPWFRRASQLAMSVRLSVPLFISMKQKDRP